MNADRLILRTVEVLSARSHEASTAILKREHMDLSKNTIKQSESPCQHHAAKDKYSSLLFQDGALLRIQVLSTL